MNLEDELIAQNLQSKSRRSKDQVEVMTNATAQLVTAGIEKGALGVGNNPPSFCLPNANGQLVKMDDLLINGPLIVTFYRGSWCPYCNLELRAYQQNLSTITAHGAQVVAISPELPDSTLSNAEKLALDFEVLSDVGNKVARDFGLVFKMPDSLVQVYLQLNNDITQHNGDGSWELPIPATYIIASDGKIAFSHVNADYLKRAEPQKVIAALAQIK